MINTGFDGSMALFFWIIAFAYSILGVFVMLSIISMANELKKIRNLMEMKMMIGGKEDSKKES